MLKKICGSALVLSLALVELSGCGSPPPPPAKSAKSEIEATESAMQSAKILASRGLYEQAKGEYERAWNEIKRGEAFAGGTDLAQLRNLKTEVRDKKTEMENKAMAAAASAKKVLPPPVDSTATAEAEAAKKAAADKAKDATAQKKNDELIAIPSKTPKKNDEPEDTGEVVAGKEKKPKGKDGETAKVDGGGETPAKPKPIDKEGIYPAITENSPPVQVVKLFHKDKFVVAYFMIYNKSEAAKRISVATFFKNNDNQITIDSRTTAAFPYERFSTKVKDLLADQSLRNLTADSEEIGGQSYGLFVSVGEGTTDAIANGIVKATIMVAFSDGTKADATGPEGAAANALPTTPKIPGLPGTKK